MSSQSSLLEITGDDIAQLNDADLRALIGMLCECDFRAENLPPAGVTWGGNQDAADGGLDVSVSGDRVPNLSGFIPDCNTGFQVKKPDMPKSAIAKEMRPKGVLRDAIKSLVKAKGAYIIVSSNGSTTDLALESRVDAMREAVSGEEGFENLHVDFYDRGRIATWARLHPSMILWVRNKIGRPLTGWQSYGNWANSPSGVKEEYVIDSKLRLFNDNKRDDEGMPTEAGISELRENLVVPRASIRLVGLSGVGKTRLVQALFDERVGTYALNPTLAFYTDISGSPSPDPERFARLLTALNQRTILVVDNCTPDLHRRLTAVCTEAGSEVSLITIEYDIREDIPEETNVFRLLSASGSVIESIILSRFKYLNQANARVIADFSDGNAKVAIALARNIEAGETLSGFKDDQLFERLFWQRNVRNESDSLLTSAGVCSLLYSFDGVDTSDNSELNLLASLAEVSVRTLFGDISRLRGRGLAQSRGQWRAILPHAVANRLARRTLDSIPKDIIVSNILNSGSERVIKSFARRLSYLHDSEVAVEIAADWLSEDGWIGESIVNLSDFGMDVFKNIAPISPKDTLGAVRRAANDPEKGQWFTSTANPKHISLVRLLRQLAYDPTLFEDSIFLMIKVNLSEKVDNNNSEVCNILQSLFRIKISGTHASPVQRANIITELLNSENERNQNIGLKLLEEALATRNLISSYGASFGAHPRGHGYRPRTSGEYLTWFELFLGICKKHILAEDCTS